MSVTEALGTTPAVRLGLDLKRAQHLVRLRIDAELKPFDLNAALWAVLHELVRAPGASSSELARAAFQTPQTVGGLIQKLTELGLVERRQARGRVVGNHLTGQGRLAYQQATQRMDTLMGMVFAGLAPADRDTLAAVLGGIIETLGGRPKAGGLRCRCQRAAAARTPPAPE
jgi:DNA-binding MarR family transcriptional regulator